MIDDRLADPAGGARLKVCGLTEDAEVEALAAGGADFAGLWYGVPGGPVDLPLEDWRRLAAAAAATEGLAGVLVTFEKDAEVLREALEGSPVRWVQLHGYQTPGTVRAVKAIARDIRVIKVLHVRGGECVEKPLIGSYERAGVDVFLFDVVTEDGRVGSTGEALDAAPVLELAEGLTRPFLIAGGISAENRSDYEALASHPLYLGVDVDTNARGPDGKIAAGNVAAISGAWKGGT